MQTLIELYDERPLENVLGVEVFRPQRVVYVCPREQAGDKSLRSRLENYFRHRGLELELEFLGAEVYDAGAMLGTLRSIVQRWPDCAVDITGGTDAVLYAAGMLGAELPIPAFTYSRRKNRFYDIRNASFAAGLPCQVRYSVEDCFRMAGGAMRQGRVDNRVLGDYLPDIEPLFRLFLDYRRQWPRLVTYIQRLSAPDPDGSVSLEARGAYEVKGDRAGLIQAPEQGLRNLEKLGFLRELVIDPETGVRFRFRDLQLRQWLRDVGSVLELYTYKCCLELGIFDDVRLSAVVDWEGGQSAVSNELDVMCTRGVTPLFVSCKIGEVHTEALNELAILRDRFGGKIARAAVVTAELGGSSMRTRAAELGINVIDLEELSAGKLPQRLRKLMK